MWTLNGRVQFGMFIPDVDGIVEWRYRKKGMRQPLFQLNNFEKLVWPLWFIVV